MIFLRILPWDSSPFFTTIWGICFVPTTKQANLSRLSGFFQLLHSSRVFLHLPGFQFCECKGCLSKFIFFWIWTFFWWEAFTLAVYDPNLEMFSTNLPLFVPPSPLNHVPFRKGNCSKTWSFCTFFFQSSDQLDFYDCFRYLYGGGWTNIQLICRVWLTCVSSPIYSQESYSSSFRKTSNNTQSNMESTPCLTISWGSSNLNQSSVSWVFSRHNFTKACFLKEEHVLEVQGNFWEWRKQHEDIQVLHGGVIQNTKSRFQNMFEENVWTFSTDGWLWMIMGSTGIIKWIIYIYHMRGGTKRSITISTCSVCNVWVYLHGKSHASFGLVSNSDILACHKWRATPPSSLTWLAGESTMNEDAFPIEIGGFSSHRHVSLVKL